MQAQKAREMSHDTAICNDGGVDYIFERTKRGTWRRLRRADESDAGHYHRIILAADYTDPFYE